MHAKDALKWVAAKQWTQLKAAVSAESPEGAYELIKVCYQKCKLKPSFKGLVENDKDQLGLTILGAFKFGLSRRHRGAGRAVDVPDHRMNRYHQVLGESFQALEKALELDRKSGLAAAFFMAVNMDPFEETDRDIAEARLLDADNVPLSGYMNLLLARCEKWGGSHKDMFRIARSRMNPEIPTHYALLARAHWEQHYWYAAFDETDGAEDRAENYFQGEVLNEITAASDAILRATMVDPAELRLANSWMMYLFIHAGLNKRALKHLNKLNGFADPSVWWFSSAPFWLVALNLRLKNLFG